MQFLSVLLILASSTSIVLGAPTSDSGVEARAILGFGKSASTKVNECFQKCVSFLTKFSIFAKIHFPKIK